LFNVFLAELIVFVVCFCTGHFVIVHLNLTMSALPATFFSLNISSILEKEIVCLVQLERGKWSRYKAELFCSGIWYNIVLTELSSIYKKESVGLVELEGRKWNRYNRNKSLQNCLYWNLIATTKQYIYTIVSLLISIIMFIPQGS